ncbi:MAG TPA: methyltransferase domain-containing protein [Rhizomicrobium sp.]|nr:methyltransferase domain-containing protein [Rhizomicrobium sp.]
MLEDAREAALLRPDIAELALSHGEALLEAGRLPEAIGELQRALRLDHEYADARLALGRAWLAAGEPQKALQAFARLDGADALIASARAMLARPRSDAGYVRHLFDQFAADYDARMISQLGYAAPQILRELADLVMAGREGLDVLDLGCGTGLTGVAFKDLARRLDGIDLSPVMIEKARARGIYDRLAVADIETAEGAARYDLLLAADTLVYLGDLTRIFTAAAESLRAGGFFLFTVESKTDEGFELGPKRRWRHSEPYLRHEAAHAAFAVAGLVACAPRAEAGQQVEGFAVALSRS